MTDDLLDLRLKGETFRLDGETYTFVDFRFTEMNPVVAIRSDGTTHRFDAVRVARAFKEDRRRGADESTR